MGVPWAWGRDMGVGVIAYSPLAMGRLTGKYSPSNKPRGAAPNSKHSRPQHHSLPPPVMSKASKRSPWCRALSSTQCAPRVWPPLRNPGTAANKPRGAAPFLDGLGLRALGLGLKASAEAPRPKSRTSSLVESVQ